VCAFTERILNFFFLSHKLETYICFSLAGLGILTLVTSQQVSDTVVAPEIDAGAASVEGSAPRVSKD
jgi:hypothetical protein